jgi:hypothetical protein
MINRYELISILLKEYGFDESLRSFIASRPDSVLLSNSGFRQIRFGFYKSK